uniref:Biotin-requiring enzyme n=1 Tax=Candidatus Kentrum sp. FM TaxID=2126340 RepID=A0A450SBT6_9GAMM|nr:MAG: Biotin-requiring enzyme [Candidatus Kentron sp. FM]VFJ69357.1 MAG: Biotin-requiring enzyme [Candidatus Kentron sp. FM]VFK18685.1 MAG: Biotin-requiring enzyme [Candidatus Kentron sp. FM]
MEKKFKITVDGRSYDVTVEDLSLGSGMTIPSPGDMAMPASPAIIPEAPSTPPAAAALAAGADTDDKASPLAGVVVSVEVSIGQQVNAGDIVIVIEAMKMKTKVTAHKSGKIANIAVKPGDGVAAGQVLLTIR